MNVDTTSASQLASINGCVDHLVQSPHIAQNILLDCENIPDFNAYSYDVGKTTYYLLPSAAMVRTEISTVPTASAQEVNAQHYGETFGAFAGALFFAGLTSESRKRRRREKYELSRETDDPTSPIDHSAKHITSYDLRHFS